MSSIENDEIKNPASGYHVTNTRMIRALIRCLGFDRVLLHGHDKTEMAMISTSKVRMNGDESQPSIGFFKLFVEGFEPPPRYCYTQKRCVDDLRE